MDMLHVISSYPPAYDYGGPPRTAQLTASALADLGHSVTIFATDALDASQRYTDFTNPERDSGVEIYRYKNVSNNLAWKNIPLAPGMATGLRSKIEEFDIVHIHEYRTIQSWMTAKIAKDAGTPVILQPHGSIPREGKSLQKSLFDFVFGYSILENSNTLIASSKVESERYKEVIPDAQDLSISHIPNGLTTDRRHMSVASGKFRKCNDIVEDELLIAFLGRLHPIKNLKQLIRAFEKLELKQAKLVLAGPDEGSKHELKHLSKELSLSDDVLFPGGMYGTSKAQLYTDSDIFVLPSTYESFGNVALEALAYGTPLVISNRCGVAEWISPTVGLTVSPSSDQLKRGIEQIESQINDGTITEAICREAAAAFTLESVSQRLESVYDDYM